MPAGDRDSCIYRGEDLLGKVGKTPPRIMGKSRRQRFPAIRVNAVAGRCNKHLIQVFEADLSAENHILFTSPLSTPCHHALVVADNKPGVIVGQARVPPLCSELLGVWFSD